MDTNTWKVYVVDDEQDIVDWLVNNVEWGIYNCEVIGWATNAEKVLRDMKELPVDFVFTDISMPGMTGLELIKAVKESYPKVAVIVISAYDKFEYVKNAFRYGVENYCLKPIDINELYDCLRNVISARSQQQINQHWKLVFRNNILNRLLSGERISVQLEEQCRVLGISMEGVTYRLVLIDIKHLEEEKRNKTIKWMESQDKPGQYCFVDSDMNLVILFQKEQIFEENLKIILDYFQREKMWENIFCCIGSCKEFYWQLPNGYKECQSFLDAGFLFSDRVVHVEEYPYHRYFSPLKTKELKDLFQNLNGNLLESVLDAIHNLVNENMNEKEKLKELICLTVFLINNFKGYVDNTESICGKNRIDTFALASELQVWVKDLFKNIFHDKAENDFVYHPYVKRAMQEVKYHYQDAGLSLQGIAEECYVSSGYLGKLFKEQTGKYFNEYLLYVRFQVAEILLCENKVRVGEIYSRVGFASQSYFNRTFRRYYGMSPMEYRKQHNLGN